MLPVQRESERFVLLQAEFVMKLLSLVGARPQFVKEALVGEAARDTKAWEHILVHSGQHYDAVLSDVFFEELGIPRPRHNLGAGSGTHAAQTAAVLIAAEKVLLDEKPDGLIVYGDTNTTLSGALAAAKLHIPVIHIESGIRMEPRTMPEEINRVLTDRISRVLCCCSRLGADNLRREGLEKGVYITGDVMYDCFLRMRPRFAGAIARERFGLADGSYFVATLHRDYNVDNPATLRALLAGLGAIARKTGRSVLFFTHPRTKKRMEALPGGGNVPGILPLEPVGYLELMGLVAKAAAVITDSGGLQKEAAFAGKRALVMMPDTGWRELVDCGWNLMCPASPEAMEQRGAELLQNAELPPGLYGDGRAARNIIDAIRAELG